MTCAIAQNSFVTICVTKCVGNISWRYTAGLGPLRKQAQAQRVGQTFGCEPDAQVDFGQLMILAGENDLTIALQLQPALRVVVQGVAIAAFDIAKTGLKLF